MPPWREKKPPLNITPSNFPLLGPNVFHKASLSHSLSFLCSQNVQAYRDELFEDIIHSLKCKQEIECIETGVKVGYTFHKSGLFPE